MRNTRQKVNVKPMRLGFIGLGNMGSELTRHLLAAGHTVSTYARGDRSRAHASRLGLKLLASPAELARVSEVVFTMVTAGSDVEAVALGPDGLVHGASPGLIQADMSTISPTIARDVGRRLNERGIAMLDAPVSGGVAGPRRGRSRSLLAAKRPFSNACGRCWSAWANRFSTWARWARRSR